MAHFSANSAMEGESSRSIGWTSTPAAVCTVLSSLPSGSEGGLAACAAIEACAVAISCSRISHDCTTEGREWN